MCLPKSRLCPAMCRLPNVGSFFAEVYAAAVELARKVLDVIVLPALEFSFLPECETLLHCRVVSFAHMGSAGDMPSCYARTLAHAKIQQKFANSLII